MNDPEKYIKKAEKYLEPTFLKSLFSSGRENIEKAIECYVEAAEIYKLNKEWVKSGDCYMKIAGLNESINEDSSESYNNAILCYNKGGAKEKYEKILDKLINMNVKDGRFSNAAELTFEKGQKLLRSITNKNDKKKFLEVLELYDQCLDFYKMDKSSNKNTISKINEAKADLIALNGIKEEMDQAKYIYEELAVKNSKNNYSKPFSVDYYAKVVFLYLAYEDFATAKAFLNKYYEESSLLYGSDVASFLENLISVMQNNGKDIVDKTIGSDNKVMNFDVAVQMYKKRINFNTKIWDNWKEIIVKKIGEKIKQLKSQEDELYEDEDDYK